MIFVILAISFSISWRSNCKNTVSQYLENQTGLTKTGPSYSGPLENYKKSALPKTSVLLPRSHFLKVPSLPALPQGNRIPVCGASLGDTLSLVYKAPSFPMPSYSVQDRF